jgi:surface protein
MFQKNRFLFVLLFAVQSLFAQIPQGFNYQATVRNQTGGLLTNEYVGIRFHIVQGTEQNNPVYSEFHYVPTDDLGSLHLMIGQGTVEAGAFNQIDWSLGDYHMGIEINTGSGFIDMGTTQLMSVPFALYALNSGTTKSASLPQGTNDGDVLRWNSATNSWTVEDVNATMSPVYLAENGITVKARDWAGIGAKGMLNGVEYTVVDIRMLRDMLDTDDGVKDVTTVCTSRITEMNIYNDDRLFEVDFNQDISNWDVSNVTNMYGMFENAQNFNQDLSAWDVRNVRNMEYMFYDAQNFNQDLSAWDVRNVTRMNSMFQQASAFNQDLSAWDVSNVQEYLNFDSDTPQWTLPKPNLKITNVSFTSTASGDGTKITVTPTSNSIEGTSYSIDFNDPAAAEGADVKETFGGGVTYDYPNEDATYTITVTASNGMESETYSADLTVDYREVFSIAGTWQMAPIAGALDVGPERGNISWWSNTEDDIATRACFFDDTFVFGADGSFANVMGESTWLEGWQGANEGCGAPVYPHDGTPTNYTYTYDAAAATITVNGVGAHLGLSRAYNGGELTSVSEAVGIESITYNVVEVSEDGNRMTVDIDFGIGYWTYVLQRDESDNGDGTGPVGGTITGVDFTIAELNVSGNEVGVTPTSTGATLYSVDFGDPAAANDEDVIATSGPQVSYTYANKAATYTINVTASASNASDVVVRKNHSVTVENRVGPLAIAGTWQMAPIAGALGVGPERGDISWWSNSEEDVTTRACLMDDEFVFGADGSFANNMGDTTWLEGWQGADEGCGAPVYPHDGAATDYTYAYDAAAGTITVNGVGAHLGISKVYNGGELASKSEATDIESITYNVVEISEDGNTMTVDIQFQADGGYWTYVLTKN